MIVYLRGKQFNCEICGRPLKAEHVYFRGGFSYECMDCQVFTFNQIKRFKPHRRLIIQGKYPLRIGTGMKTSSKFTKEYN